MKTEARKENRGGVGEDSRSRSKEGVDDQCKYCQHVSQEDAAWASGGRRRAGVVSLGGVRKGARGITRSCFDS